VGTAALGCPVERLLEGSLLPFLDRNRIFRHGVLIGMRSSTVTLALLYALAAASSAFACQCGAGPRGKNAWEIAKLEAEGSTVIFEGTPVHAELKWDLLSAKDGELIPADMFSIQDEKKWGRMVVTFRVQRPYKGDMGPEVQLHTGLGGGDCGAIYQPGLNYLVYAWGPSPDQLGVNMCSPGGWIGDREIEVNLRHLRNERPAPEDLRPIERWTQATYAATEKKRKLEFEERQKRYAAAMGRICGSLLHEGEPGGTVSFLSTQGYSAGQPPLALVKDGGAFCSDNLGPGKYYLYFVGDAKHGSAALYYPGVTEQGKATAIEVGAGQTVSKVVFNVPSQGSHSVQGIVSGNDKLDFGNSPEPVMVLLIRTDGDRRGWYSAVAKPILPKVAVFRIDDVPPGHYAAAVVAPAGWMTRKAEVNVTHMKFISIELIHKK